MSSSQQTRPPRWDGEVCAFLDLVPGPRAFWGNIAGLGLPASGTLCGFLSARTWVTSTEFSAPEATLRSIEGGFHHKDISENVPR